MSPISYKQDEEIKSFSSLRTYSKTIIGITAVTLINVIVTILEITGGAIFNSTVLLGHGLHTLTHVAAFTLNIFSYHYAKKHELSKDFSFGTGKVLVLGSFASSISLLVLSITIITEAIHGLWSPENTIHYTEAIIVSLLALAVNLLNAVILKKTNKSCVCFGVILSKFKTKPKHHSHNHQDYNLRAAYLHIISDVILSCVAIFGLLVAKVFNLYFIDSILGMLSGVIIITWSISLIKETANILLDKENGTIKKQIIQIIQDDNNGKNESTEISDIHVWNAVDNKPIIIMSLISTKNSGYFKNLFTQKEVPLSHITIEINS